MSCGRASNWLHPDGEEKTVSILKESLSPFKGWIADHGAQMYDGLDMKIGINTDQLKAASPVVSALIAIDGRGGIHGQRQLSKALQQILADDSLKIQVLTKKHSGTGPASSDL